MSEIKDGGAAFPRPGYKHGDADTFIAGHSGMTLRDYFASHALMGLLGSNHFRYEPSEGEDYAKWAFDMADAMIAERSK